MCEVLKDEELYENNGEIMVSVYFPTYNHSKYIERALKGILEQNTTFLYEVLIHDDASTDGTQEIIRRYQGRHSDKIIAVLRKENQFSKGYEAVAPGMIRMARGKYLAVCEGDDYWCSPNKLQLQVDYMERHPKCKLCFHEARMKKEKNEVFIDNYCWNEKYFKGSAEYSFEDMVRLESIPTAASMYRREILLDMPDLSSPRVKIGDIQKELYATHFGYAYCISGKMCVYNIGNINSYTASQKMKGIEQYNNQHLGMCEIYENVDRATGYEHHESLSERIFHLKQSNVEFSEAQMEYLKENDYKVYIYGQGMDGKWCYKKVKEKGLAFGGFIVSEGYGRDDILGEKVYGYNECRGILRDGKSAVYICTRLASVSGIIRQMEKDNINQYIGFCWQVKDREKIKDLYCNSPIFKDI